MKKIYLFLTVLLCIASCDRVDYGDINVNPYASQEANVDALLRAGTINYFTAGGRFYLSNATLYSQYQSQTQYTDEQRYNEAPGFWGNFYTSLVNLKAVADAPNTDIRGDNSNMVAIAELTSVLIWKKTTDSFGDIPYKEALMQEENPSPAYTPQSEIYADLVARTIAAKGMLKSSSFAVDADIIYGGNISKWRKFANSMLMSLAMQMSKKDATTAISVFEAALADGPITANADSFVFVPDTAGNVTNPWSSLRPADFDLSRTLTDAMQGVVGGENITNNTTADNRLAKFSTGGMTGKGLVYGYGDNAGNDSDAKINTAISSPGSDLVVFPASYTHFLIAEYYVIMKDAANAQAFMKSGIETSYAQWGVAGGSDYATQRIADAGATSPGHARVIGEEKWIGLFPNGYAAWAEQRRTGIPALKPSPQPLNAGTLPERFPYPNEESTINSTNYAVGVKGLSPQTDNNSSKVWWNQ